MAAQVDYASKVCASYEKGISHATGELTLKQFTEAVEKTAVLFSIDVEMLKIAMAYDLAAGGSSSKRILEAKITLIGLSGDEESVTANTIYELFFPKTMPVVLRQVAKYIRSETIAASANLVNKGVLAIDKAQLNIAALFSGVQSERLLGKEVIDKANKLLEHSDEY